MGKSNSQTAGYRYSMALHFGICYGPIDKLKRILWGDRVAWAGGETASGTININAPQLFGGDEREGGIRGTAHVMMGEDTQTLPAPVAALLPTPSPAFRGVFSLFYDGQITANNPYVKAPAFQLQRIDTGWHGGTVWYGAKSKITVLTVEGGMEVAVDPEFVAEASGTGIIGSIVVPTHSAGDTLILITKRTDGGSPIPAAQAGWTTPPDGTWMAGTPAPQGYRIEYLVDSDNSVSLIGVASGNVAAVLIYRGLIVGQVVSEPYSAGTGNSSLPLSPSDPGGAWFMQIGSNTLVQGSVDGGDVVERYNQDESLSAGDVIVTDTDGPVLESPVVSFAWLGEGYGAAATAELVPAPILADDVFVAMNPAHIIYQCITDPVWGMGYPEASIDTDTFTAVADVLYAEGLGLCLLWNKQDELGAFIRTVLDHIGGILYTDPKTGKFSLKLLRGDYDPDTLDVYDESNVLALESFQRVGYGDTVNEITVVFRDVQTNKDTPVTVQNLANVQAQGAVVSQTRQYPGLPTASLALRIAQRDLIAASTPLAKARIRVNRSGWALFPGDVCKLAWPKLGLAGVVFRVLGVDYGGLAEGYITVDLAEDVFGMPTNSYAAQEPGGWVPPNTKPVPIVEQDIVEAPYRSLSISLPAADLSGLDSDAAYLSALAAKPKPTALAFQIHSRVGTGEFKLRTNGDFVPYAELDADIGYTDTTIALASPIDLDLVASGDIAIIGTGQAAEWVQVLSVDVSAPSMVVSRGMLDTVPALHTAGATIFFDDARRSPEKVERATGEEVDFRLATIATGGTLGIGAATNLTATAARRQFRPFPPGNVKVNGTAYPATATDAITITWAHRDRLQQTADLVAQDDGNIGPEAGTSYSIELINDTTDVVLVTASGLTSTTWTSNVGQNGTYPLRIKIWTMRGGVESWQRHDFVIPSYTNTLVITKPGVTLTAGVSLVFPAAGASLTLVRTQAAQAAKPATGWRSTVTLSSLGGGLTVGIGTVLTAQFTRYYTIGSDLFGEAIQAGVTMSTPRTRVQALGDWAVIANLNSTLHAYGWNIFSSGTEANPTAELVGPVGQDWDVYPTPAGTPPGSVLFGLQQTIIDRGGPAILTDLPQLVTATLVGTPNDGDRYIVTLNGVEYGYTTAVGDTADDVAQGLAAVVDAATEYSASASGAVVTISGLVPSNAFTYFGTASGARAVGFAPTLWNVSDKHPDVVLTNATRSMNGGNSSNRGVRSAVSRTTGKRYFEIKTSAGFSSGDAVDVFGAVASASTPLSGQPIFGFSTGYHFAAVRGNTQYGNEGGYIGSHAGSGWAAAGGAQVLGLAVDLDAFTVRVFDNGVERVTISYASGGGPMFAYASATTISGATLDLCTKAVQFSYTPPAGYTAWA